jgi:hypothetical protein
VLYHGGEGSGFSFYVLALGPDRAAFDVAYQEKASTEANWWH